MPRTELPAAPRAAALACGLLLAAAGSGTASTLVPAPAAPDYVHEVFSVGDGLPKAGISHVLQTRDGFLWLASFDGLVRFDGVRFEVFDSERVPALGSNRIVDLLETRDGTLWIRSEQGHIARFASGTFTACGRPEAGRMPCDLDQGPGDFSLLQQDHAGRLWVGSGSALFLGDEHDARVLRQVGSFGSDSSVRYLFSHPSGRLFMATRVHLWEGRWDDPSGGFTRLDLGPELHRGQIESVAVDDRGEVWISTPLVAGRVRAGRFAPVLEPGGRVVRDSRGALWISAGRRLFRYRGGDLEVVLDEPPEVYNMMSDRNVAIAPNGDTWIAWTRHLVRNGVSVLRTASDNFRVSSVAVDRWGTVWATTTASGELHAFHPSRLRTFTEGLPLPVLYPVYEDRDGTLWVGEHFLATLDPDADRFRVVLQGPPARTPNVSAILRDRAGTLWVGAGDGLFLVGAGGYERPPGMASLAGRRVFALTEGADGTLWAGTNLGLFRYDRSPADGLTPGGRWTEQRIVDGPDQPRIRVIRELPDGSLWLGTNGAGVIRFRDGRFTTIDRTRGLSSDLVRAIWPAPDGRLWIGTENGGLNRLDPVTVDDPEGPAVAVVSQRHGLHSSGVHQIVDDGLGNLWMSSNQGIFRARLEDLDAVADGVRPKLETVAYTERDGMLDAEANGGVQQAGLRDRQGRIWFPTMNGLVRVDPRQLLHSGEPPPVCVDRVLVGDRRLALENGGVRLSPRERSFQVAYTAPWFQAPGRLRFRYRLVPYDEAWVDVGARREAFYTKVPPGRYTFEVAVNAEGVWSEPALLALDVAPRFFETRSFVAGCALLALVLVAGGVRLRESQERARRLALEEQVRVRTATIAEQARKLRELDDLKSQFFANVSHEFRTPLTLVLGPLRDALGGDFGPLGDALASEIASAEKNAGRLLGLVDQLLDVARLDAGGLELRLHCGDLGAHLRQRVEAFTPLAERRRIDLALTGPDHPVEIVLDPLQLEKVFDNLLANALKFTPAGGTVRVALEAPPDHDHVTVTVLDDGHGIPESKLEQIFDRFYQLRASEQPWSGTGLGLALARQLTELHGGTITAANAEEGGACFTVTLPLGGARPATGEAEAGDGREPNRPAWTSPGAALATAEALEPAGPGGGAGDDPADSEDRTTVLVVDDNAEVRSYLRRHLEPTYRVVEAADGEEALERARRMTPDLVVSDIMMPGLDGNALFRALRQDPELELVPVILLTAKASPESRLEGLREGVDDYLVKPFDPHELLARIENLIASRRRLREIAAAPPRGLEISEIDAVPADQAFLERVRTTIEQRLGDKDLTVEALAAAVGCERSHLLRRLRSLTDETPSGMIRSLRLRRAAQLLRANAGNVSEIAYGVGFKSVAHFSNAFRDYHGERPSAFAARHR